MPSRHKITMSDGIPGLPHMILQVAIPHWSLRRMRRAVQENDAVFVSDHVDIPILRESLRDMFKTQMAKELSKAEFMREFPEDKKIHARTVMERVEHDGKHFLLGCRDREGHGLDLSGGGLLVATGVVPNSGQLALEAAGVKVDKRVFNRINDRLETPARGIFAIGDVAGNYLFRHRVYFEAECQVHARFLADHPYPIAYPPVPSAVFTHP